MRSIAIIPARSGSKGLPDKNIRLFCGKPLIAYSIEAAKETGLFDQIHVSTDSEKYAEIATKYGADVPFLRPSFLANDTAGTWDVVKDTLNRYKALGKEFDTVVLLQPTSPLRTAQDIEKAYRLFKEKEADSVVSVCEADHSPLWMNRLPEDFSMKGFLSNELLNAPRQELPTYYRLNGSIYIVSAEFLQKQEDIYSGKCFAYVMQTEVSQDIDNEVDFLTAEFLYRYYQKNH